MSAHKINVNNFDFLRMLFAVVVALAHIIKLSEAVDFQSYSRFLNTKLAINGFFVISGFLIAKSFETNSNIKKYLIKRASRIIPAYAFVIFACAIAFSFISTLSLSDYFSNFQFWKYLGSNLIFQNYLEPCLPAVFENNYMCAVNGALWTIKVEEAFYLLVPFLYWLMRVKKVNSWFLIAFIYVSSILYFNYFNYFDMYRIAKQLPGAMAFFIVGITYYKHFSFFYKWRHYLIVPCLVLFFLEQWIFISHILKPITYGFMVFYLAYSFKDLNNFGKYGDFTYGIYIYHFPLIQLFVYLGFFKDYNFLVISSALMSLVVVLAILSWNLLEVPFLKRGGSSKRRTTW